MTSTGYVLLLLGVIAAAALIQTVVLVVLIVRASRMVGRVGERVDRLEQEMRPHLARLGGVADGLARLSDGVERQMPQIQSALGDASQRVRRTGEAVERVAQRPIGLLATALAYTVARRYLAHRGRVRGRGLEGRDA